MHVFLGKKAKIPVCSQIIFQCMALALSSSLRAMLSSRHTASLDQSQREEPGSVSSLEPRGLNKLLLVLVLGGLSAFGPLSIDMYLPSLPALGRDLGANASEVQLTLSFSLLGLALGQVIAGPLSDALGRRRPLLIGLVIYALASVLCVVAPSVYILSALRLMQGLAGAAGIVIARAIVRDIYSGIAAARFFSLLMLVNGLAPILAPVLGGLVIRYTSWRGIFWILTLAGVLLLLAAALVLKESLPAERRQPGGMRTSLTMFRQLLSNRFFLGYALSCGLAFAAMFAYISGSPFVLQDIYGVSPQLFSIMFGVNALGLIIIGQINGRIVDRFPLKRLLLIGLIVSAVGAVALFCVVSIGEIGLVGILPGFFLVVSSIGLISPNATALAMADHPHAAGSASALLGVLQFAIGAVVSPLVGVAGMATALPMAIVMAVSSLTALGSFALLVRGG